MNVGELKTLLSKYDDNVEVVIEYKTWECNEINDSIMVHISKREKEGADLYKSTYSYANYPETPDSYPALLLRFF